MITDAADLYARNIEKHLHLLLLNISKWLTANPPWLIGIVLVLAIIIYYLLHLRPKQRKKRHEKQCELNLLTSELTQQEQYYRLEAEHWEKKFKEEQQNNLNEREQRRASAEKARQEKERVAKEQKVIADRRVQELATQAATDEAARKKAGTDFERRVIALIKKDFVDLHETGRARLLYGVTLPYAHTSVYDSGDNPQIDIVLIDTSGIYVIECKCWKGLILGVSNWAYCLQFQCDIIKNFCPITKVNKDKPFVFTSHSNPLAQNAVHKRELYAHLKNCVSNDPHLFKEISVFAECGSVDFFLRKTPKGKEVRDDYIWFGMESELIATLRNYDTITPTFSRLSPEDVDLIYRKLSPYEESL